MTIFSALLLSAIIEIPVTNGVSLAEAFEKAISARAKDEKAEIVIDIKAKGRALNRPLFIDGVFQPKEAGKLIIQGSGKTRPRLFGSLPVRGWKKLKKKMNGRSDVWEADVSKFELSEQLDCLFMDGKMLTLARYPNFNPSAPYAGGWAYVPGRWISMYKFPEKEPAGNRTCMRVGKKDWRNWSVPSEGRICIFPRQRYGSSYVPIGDFDRENRLLLFARNLCDMPRPGDTYILSGFREELDDYGEWCHDLKAAKLYLIPPKGKDPNKDVVTLPTIDAIFEMEKANNVEIRNLEICAARKALVANGGSCITMRGCEVHDISRRAIEFRWGLDNALLDSDIHNLGGGAVHILGGNVKRLNGTVIENCHFHRVGKIDHVSSVIFLEAHGVKVRHCLIHDIPGWAIYHMGNFHEFTDNRIHHYMLETEDGAAMYTCGYSGALGTVIARNWISDGVGIAKCAGWGPLRFFQNCHGLYFDANPSGGPGGALVYDNVFERISGMGLKLNSNRCMMITNNVFYHTGRGELLRWSYAIQMTGGKYNPEEHSGTVREWNAILSARPDLQSWPFFACPPDRTPGGNHSWSNVLQRNIWYYPTCPTQRLIIHGGIDFSSHVIDYNWICPGKDAKYPSIQDYDWKNTWTRKMGHDTHSVVTDSIGFANPKKGDFTPKNKAIMKKLGIKPLNMVKCGLYVNEYRKKIEKEPEGASSHPEWFKHPVHINPPANEDPFPGVSR